MIGDVDPRAARREHAAHLAERLRTDDPPLLLLLSRPGIGEVNVVDGDRRGRNQKVHRVTRLDPQRPHVGQSQPLRFAVHFARPTQKPFDAEKVALGILEREPHEERAVAAAQVDLDRVRVAEQCIPIQGLEPTRWGVEKLGRVMLHGRWHE